MRRKLPKIPTDSKTEIAAVKCTIYYQYINFQSLKSIRKKIFKLQFLNYFTKEIKVFFKTDLQGAPTVIYDIAQYHMKLVLHCWTSYTVFISVMANLSGIRSNFFLHSNKKSVGFITYTWGCLYILHITFNNH